MEVLGRKFAMNTACLFFGIGTIGCALSPGMYWLIAARAVAGVSALTPHRHCSLRLKRQLGGGGLLTVSSVVVTDLVPLRDRGIYQGGLNLVREDLSDPEFARNHDDYLWSWVHARRTGLRTVDRQIRLALELLGTSGCRAVLP